MATDDVAKESNLYWWT